MDDQIKTLIETSLYPSVGVTLEKMGYMPPLVFLRLPPETFKLEPEGKITVLIDLGPCGHMEVTGGTLDDCSSIVMVPLIHELKDINLSVIQFLCDNWKANCVILISEVQSIDKEEGIVLLLSVQTPESTFQSLNVIHRIKGVPAFVMPTPEPFTEKKAIGKFVFNLSRT